MAVHLINPDVLVTHPLYRQAAVATGNTQIYLAGMAAWDEHGQFVAPDNLAGQVDQVYRNVAKGLAAAGTKVHDVVRCTWYAAKWKRSMYDAFVAGTEERE